MKKVLLSAAIILGSLSTYALPISIENVNHQTVVVQEGFVEVEKVPDTVKNALETAYPGAVIEKAYINATKDYKLEIAVGDQKATVYADAKGSWINK